MNKKTNLNISIDRYLEKQFARICAYQEKTKNEIIELLIKKYCERFLTLK